MVKSRSSRSPSKSLNSSNVSLYEFVINIWDNYRWELFLCISILTIIICWIFKKKDTEYKGFDIDTTVIKKKQIPSLLKSQIQKGTYKNEEKCREVVQKIYNRPFKKIRPNFLKNPKTRRNLELDMYNDELKIAVEYNGIQHRTYAPYFHKSINDYNDQVERDNFKIRRCKEEGVTLIIVPDTVRYNEIESFIWSELKKSGRLN